MSSASISPAPLAEPHQVLEQLAAITGPEFVSANKSGAITVSPANTNEVSDVLAFASKQKRTVSPQGGRTKQLWGGGDAPHIYLSLARLNRVVEHPWQDLTCTVQAGCTWSSLQQTLA